MRESVNVVVTSGENIFWSLQVPYTQSPKPNLTFSFHCPSQVWLVWPMWSTSSALSSWRPRISSSSPTVACEEPSPSPSASCWKRISSPWGRCSSQPSSPLSSSPSLFRYEYAVYVVRFKQTLEGENFVYFFVCQSNYTPILMKLGWRIKHGSS